MPNRVGCLVMAEPTALRVPLYVVWYLPLLLPRIQLLIAAYCVHSATASCTGPQQTDTRWGDD